MKLHHLVPIFLLALTVPGSAWAGSIQKGVCGCSQKSPTQKTHVQKTHVQKTHVQKTPVQKTPVQKTHVQKGHTQKSKSSTCGCTQKGQVHTSVQKGKGVFQKSHGSVQKGVPHTKGSCSKGGCSTCCLAVIPAVLNGVDHFVTNTVGHVASLFACDTCGGSKSGHSKSKGCGCGSGSSPGTVLPGIPPNPFEDDDLQPPPLPTSEARLRIERRPLHRHVTRTASAPVSRVAPVFHAAPVSHAAQISRAAQVLPAEPRTLSISVAAPLKQAAPRPAPQRVAKPAPPVRTISAQRRSASIPHNPLRAN